MTFRPRPLLVPVVLLATVIASPLAAAESCDPSVPTDEVLAILDAIVTAVDQTGANTLQLLNASSDNVTSALEEILAGLPGVIVLPFSQLSNIVTASGTWGSAQVFVLRDLLIVVLEQGTHALVERIQELGDCLPP